MLEKKINQWISVNYGELPDSVKQNIAITFELYYEQFTWWYAEIKTLETYKHLTR